MLEPIEIIKCIGLWFLGLKKHFNFYGFNPISLTREQASETQPVLIIHGNYHNQGLALPFGRPFKKDGRFSVFTCNLPGEEITPRDKEIVERRIEEIQALYAVHGVDNVKVNIVGISRGGFVGRSVGLSVATIGEWRREFNKQNGLSDSEGDLDASGEISDQEQADEQAENRRYSIKNPKVGRVITIGAPVEEFNLDVIRKYCSNGEDDLYEITGKYDVIAGSNSILEENYRTQIACGHVKLGFPREVHERVISILGSPQRV